MSVEPNSLKSRAVRLATTLAVSLPLLSAASPAAQEHLAAPDLPGFVTGHEAANEQQSIREEVLSGETVQNWTRMVTTQRFAGMPARVHPALFLDGMARMLSASCPGATTSRPVYIVRSGQAAAQLRADCPLLAETGKPETFIILAVTGNTDLHVKQVAFRGVPTDAGIRWGEEFLAGVSFCSAADSSEVCTS